LLAHRVFSSSLLYYLHLSELDIPFSILPILFHSMIYLPCLTDDQVLRAMMLGDALWDSYGLDERWEVKITLLSTGISYKRSIA